MQLFTCSHWKRWFCTSKQTFLSFFAFLAEFLKSPLCTRCMQGSEISLNWYLTSKHVALFFVSKQEDKHQQTGDLSFILIRFLWNENPSYAVLNWFFCLLQCCPETAISLSLGILYQMVRLPESQELWEEQSGAFSITVVFYGKQLTE